MGLFGKDKKKTVDLTGRYDRQVEKMESIRGIVNRTQNTINHPASKTSQSQPQSNFSFLRDMASSSSEMPIQQESDETSDERKRKLAKRLADITEKLEDVSTQLYHLQQRVELLERKTKTSGFE